MGKRIISQRRGKGSTTYRAHAFRWAGKLSHRAYDEKEKTSCIKGVVQDLLHSSGHSAPLVKIKYETGEVVLAAAAHSIKVNDIIFSGLKSEVKNGNILPLKQIPEGTVIHNIEVNPGDGGKLCRTSGSSAKIIDIKDGKVTVQLPSKKKKDFNGDCRATIGLIAGGGRLDKPILKAGRLHHLKRARGKLYPKTSAVAMNAVDHPFGSGRGRHVGKPKTSPRYAPAGRRAGKIHSRRTGKK
jgi:large subunit ribosomal protein L2